MESHWEKKTTVEAYVRSIVSYMDALTLAEQIRSLGVNQSGPLLYMLLFIT